VFACERAKIGETPSRSAEEGKGVERTQGRKTDRDLACDRRCNYGGRRFAVSRYTHEKWRTRVSTMSRDFMPALSNDIDLGAEYLPLFIFPYIYIYFFSSSSFFFLGQPIGFPTFLGIARFDCSIETMHGHSMQGPAVSFPLIIDKVSSSLPARLLRTPRTSVRRIFRLTRARKPSRRSAPTPRMVIFGDEARKEQLDSR